MLVNIPARFSADSENNKDENTVHYPTEFLNSVSLSEIPDHGTTLEKFFTIMTVRTITRKYSYCNQTIYISFNV